MKVIELFGPCQCSSGKPYVNCCFEKDNGVNFYELMSNMKQQNRRIEPHINVIKSQIWKGKRLRAFRDRIELRPINETFHEYILEKLKIILGYKWYSAEHKKETQERHVILRWIESFNEKCYKANDNKQVCDGIYETKMTGNIRSLLQLAYDCYCLQLTSNFSNSLRRRLRDYNGFQGARYEIAVASIFARADLSIEFFDEETIKAKHCEFIAKDKLLDILIGIEVKSKHRHGVLNQKWIFTTRDISNDVITKYCEALSQKPDGIPFIIFIDTNLPITSLRDEHLRRRDEIFKALEKYHSENYDKAACCNAIIITNFCPYYYGERVDSFPNSYIIFKTINPLFKLDNIILDKITRSMDNYTIIPNEIFQ